MRAQAVSLLFVCCASALACGDDRSRGGGTNVGRADASSAGADADSSSLDGANPGGRPSSSDAGCADPTPSNCEGLCVDFATDNSHCGECNHHCPGGLCRSGECLQLSEPWRQAPASCAIVCAAEQTSCRVADRFPLFEDAGPSAGAATYGSNTPRASFLIRDCATPPPATHEAQAYELMVCLCLAP